MQADSLTTMVNRYHGKPFLPVGHGMAKEIECGRARTAVKELQLTHRPDEEPAYMRIQTVSMRCTKELAYLREQGA